MYVNVSLLLLTMYILISSAILYEIFSLNSVVVVGSSDKMYLTNFRYFNNPWAEMIELMFMIDWGQLLYYDGAKVNVVEDGYGWPNGINASPDKK